jgi:hypothetical protein
MAPTDRNRVRLAFRRRSIEANLFPFAHAAVEPWAEFRWHSAAGEVCDAWKEKSSQALAIDVFGSLKLHPARDRALDGLARALGLPAGGPWEVALEWRDPDGLLDEKTSTWADAMARSPNALILFEGKFCEPDGGGCSQVQPIGRGRHKGLRQCSGHFVPQVNPVNGAQARCALNAKGIRYWDFIPDVFGYDAGQSYAPCPFAGAWFQWMRNLTTCVAVARAHGLKAAFVVVYADGPGLPMAERVRQAEWRWLESRVDPGVVTFRALSYQRLLALARQADRDDAVWRELEAWVARKVAAVCGLPHVAD